MKRALITGVTGQDGSYLAELLQQKGYEVHGLVRRTSDPSRQSLMHRDGGGAYAVHYGDLSDSASVATVLEATEPDEIYNLGAQSHVVTSFAVPSYTAQVNGVGVLSLLEAVRLLKLPAKIYQASTSELFSGDREEAPQGEQTPFRPRNPYGAAKLYALNIGRIYRESYGMFVANGILFNHESPRRGLSFVSRKITNAVARIVLGQQEALRLGNLDSYRDWGYAPEYVEAMWLLLQQPKPLDLVVATGQSHSVREFVEAVFSHAGMPLTWRGQGTDEVGVDAGGTVRVSVDPAHYRPNEVRYLCGDPSRAESELGWKAKTTFAELTVLMYDAEIAALRGE